MAITAYCRAYGILMSGLSATLVAIASHTSFMQCTHMTSSQCKQVLNAAGLVGGLNHQALDLAELGNLNPLTQHTESSAMYHVHCSNK